MVTLPVRCAVLLLAETLTLTLPFPLPLAPEVTVSHEAELDAVHAPVAVQVGPVVKSPSSKESRVARCRVEVPSPQSME